MQVKTKGIILHTLKYSDTATIVTVYTYEFGRVAYMVYGTSKKKSTVRTALLQPLSIVEMDVFHSLTKNIQQIRDLRMNYNFENLPFDPVKNSLALFISEILYRTLRQSEPDEHLFLFLENSILQLDCCERGIANFHIVFLLKLTRYLGFEPNREDNQIRFFDMINGLFQNVKPQHPQFLSESMTENLLKALELDFSNSDELILTRETRIKLLEGIIDYYRLHVAGFFGVHSLEVLQSLFD